MSLSLVLGWTFKQLSNHTARNTATAFNVFFWLQITNFDVSLLRSAPNGADHIDIHIFILHVCTLPTQGTSNKNRCLESRQFCFVRQLTQRLEQLTLRSYGVRKILPV